MARKTPELAPLSKLPHRTMFRLPALLYLKSAEILKIPIDAALLEVGRCRGSSTLPQIKKTENSSIEKENTKREDWFNKCSNPLPTQRNDRGTNPCSDPSLIRITCDIRNQRLKISNGVEFFNQPPNPIPYRGGIGVGNQQTNLLPDLESDRGTNQLADQLRSDYDSNQSSDSLSELQSERSSNQCADSLPNRKM
ncbi:hypothetical protein AVEN_122557-1 [Araneus ventricosus]|uniref:Uncharacterized protein n=1 Tax=Araneus ventricosus TaxID=182803 RepID=A0A4Y2IQE3_ARAVE|nr:hypothetical protein AVEN_122557-1 [Araneus ventricosus]